MTFKPLTARQQWVSKTDLARWYRCRYAFWLLDTGQITFEETVSQFQLSLIHAGQEYQELVEQSATPITIEPGDLPALLETEITILGTPEFKNRPKKLLGRPDGIDAARGALYPIEIKSHRAPTRLDGLELAFYWLLLEPYRTRQAEPAGVLILRRDGRPFRIDVPVTADLLATAKKLISEIRAARRTGVTPRVCGCTVCAKARRDEVVEWVTEYRHVSMIFGVGPVYGDALEAAGYGTWDSLVGADPDELASIVTASGAKGCGPLRVSGWQLHARALAAGLPEFGPGAKWPVRGPYIALDLEYDVTPDKDRIWLAGAAVVDDGSADYHHWWAGSDSDVKDAMTGLQALLRDHPGLPVVTWAGLSADVPRIAAASKRLELPAVIDQVTARHFDAYQWALNYVRLPTIGLGLKEVASYFGFRAAADVADGLQALMLYYDWLDSKDEKIKARLIEYNRDDLDALMLIVARLCELTGRGAVTPKPADYPLTVYIPAARVVAAVLARLAEVLQAHPGPTPMHVRTYKAYRGDLDVEVLPGYRVAAGPALTGDLKTLLGPSCLEPWP